ncbi:uncharacterized protein J3D65DRAFT_601341 [Phyllosticta citribraziliensis]|uniref:GPI anchored protein n=1 Tax=Phyllosticta citribraziliensis TaxID=989973 RepID=A0ABR1M1E3_9PEZI
MRSLTALSVALGVFLMPAATAAAAAVAPVPEDVAAPTMTDAAEAAASMASDPTVVLPLAAPAANLEFHVSGHGTIDYILRTLRQAPISTDTSTTAAGEAALSSTSAVSSSTSTLAGGAPVAAASSTSLSSSSSVATDDQAAAGAAAPAAAATSSSTTSTTSTTSSSTSSTSLLPSTTTTAATDAADAVTAAPSSTVTTGPTASVSTTTMWVEVWLTNGSPTWTPTVLRMTFAAVPDQMSSAGSGSIGLGIWSTAVDNVAGAQPTPGWHYVGAGLGAGVGVLGALL